MWRLFIAFIAAGCGAGSVESAEPATHPRESTDTSLTASDRGRPSRPSVQREAESDARAESPRRRPCDDPSFHGGDLVIGGEPVRILPTCPTESPVGASLPDR